MATQATIERILAHGVSNRIVRWALLLWLDGADERVVLLNARGNNPNECNATERKCWKHGNNGGNGAKTADMSGLSEDSIRRSARLAMAEYHNSTDHPSADDVASGKVPIRTALQKGFEATLGGQKLVFFTHSLKEKYEGKMDFARVDLIPEALKNRQAFSIRPHSAGQTVFVQQGKSIRFGLPIVIIADRETGVVRNIMRPGDVKYVKKNFK